MLIFDVICMAVSLKTVISFGLVAIPVALYKATQDNDIHFNQLHNFTRSGKRMDTILPRYLSIHMSLLIIA